MGKNDETRSAFAGEKAKVGQVRLRRTVFNEEKCISVETKPANDTEWGIDTIYSLDKVWKTPPLLYLEAYLDNLLVNGYQLVRAEGHEWERDDYAPKTSKPSKEIKEEER